MTVFVLYQTLTETGLAVSAPAKFSLPLLRPISPPSTAVHHRSSDHKRKMRRHCRLWWPMQLLSNEESPSSILLGWFVTCSPSSLDIIVAFTCSEVLLSSYSPGIEGIIHGTCGSMPSVLEDRSKFSVLGLCVTDPTTSNGLMNGAEDDKKKFSEFGNALQEGDTDRKNNSRSCCCFQLDGSLRKSSQYVLGRSNWVLLMFDSPEQTDVGIHRLPKLHHIHWNGLTVSQYDVHVIIYETPSFGAHHFSLCHPGSNEKAKTSIKNPKWVDELHKKQQFIELDTITLAINCTAAAKRIFETHLVPRRSLSQLSIFPIHDCTGNFTHFSSSLIQALAALWRLFRGRKWNPLRQRLDSFDYTVKQHIVGSLLFTPLLLLLPTTSVFYIFFSIVDTTINLVCLLIEVTISVIHVTPYTKIFLWFVRPRRFPSGIWLEIIGCQSNSTASPSTDITDEMTSYKESLHLKDFNREKSSNLVSALHSNYLSLGKIISPHYKHVFLGVSGSTISTVAHGILIGQRMPSMRGTLLPSPMPWTSMHYKEYWRVCHDSLIACFR
ncbi:Phosphatidylinositol N-acetylglucosaminyltransferase subunit Q [Glycine soja]